MVAFEADPENAETLVENRDRNGLKETLEIVPRAVWSSSSSDLEAFDRVEQKSHMEELKPIDIGLCSEAVTSSACHQSV